jgi:hypothetical protein
VDEFMEQLVSRGFVGVYQGAVQFQESDINSKGRPNRFINRNQSELLLNDLSGGDSPTIG